MTYFITNKKFFLMFMIIYKKMVEVENAITMATENERAVIARWHRTQIFVKRKTYIIWAIPFVRDVTSQN